MQVERRLHSIQFVNRDDNGRLRKRPWMIYRHDPDGTLSVASVHSTQWRAKERLARLEKAGLAREARAVGSASGPQGDKSNG